MDMNSVITGRQKVTCTHQQLMFTYYVLDPTSSSSGKGMSNKEQIVTPWNEYMC